MPDVQQRLLQLVRSVEVKTKLYTQLLARTQELDVVKAGTVGNVRIIDEAAVDASLPISPNRRAVRMLGLVLGFAAGVAFVLLRLFLKRGVESPEQIEALGMPVLASIPFSSEQSAKGALGAFGVKKLQEHTDVSLAISLHAPSDELRNELVPINKKYPIAELMKTCRDYVEHLGPARKLVIEYTLMRGVNDQAVHAKALATLLQSLRCKVNLIPFNPFPGSGYERHRDEDIYAFQTTLMKAGFITMVRTTRGDDINAACGQLVGMVEDRTRRQSRYRERLAQQIPAVEVI